jgi:GTP-dependent dephospho-CoA kinase
MPLSHEDEKTLKKPFGVLIPDARITKQRISFILKDVKKIIAVGDATTERLTSFGIIPDVAVIDGKERRQTRDMPDSYPAKEMRCKNPAGVISRCAIELLKTALIEKQPVRVLVEGEEDMLALPLFVLSPIDAAILYGQPLEGLVVVKMTEVKRKQAKDLMDRIGVQD